MIRFGGRSVRGFALSDGDDVDSLVAAKLAEGGYADVSAYQAANGLSVDGVAGHDTLTKMGYGYLYDLTGQGKLQEGQTQLDTKKTPLTPEQAAQALSAGYQAIQGTPPTPEVLALLIAQSGNETGDWRSISNYNFGGVKATSGNKYVQAMVDGNPGNRHVYAFAAYPTAAEGAKAYLDVLNYRPAWWTGLHSGDPETYVNALVSIPGAHYFEAPTSDYLAAVQQRFAKYIDLARQYARQLSASDVATSNVAAKVYKALAPLDVIAMARREIVPPQAVTSTVDWIREHRTAVAVGVVAITVGGAVLVLAARR